MTMEAVPSVQAAAASRLEEAKEYLIKVLPWPQDGDRPAFVNLHWTRHNKKYAKPLWSGRAVRSPADAVKAIEFALKDADTRDIYVCLSTQREAEEKVSQNGFKYTVPIRGQENAVALKSLFLDLD